MEKISSTKDTVKGLLGHPRTAFILTLFNLAIGILSFLSQITIAKTFGTGSEMDAYAAIVAFPSIINGLIPTLMTGVLVPSIIQHSSEERKFIVYKLFWILSGLAILIGSIGIMISSYWVDWLMYKRSNWIYIQTILLKTTWLLWISVSFNIMVSFFSAIRYLQKFFFLATILPSLNFIFIIFLVTIFGKYCGVLTLGLALLLGAFFQFIILLPIWWRKWKCLKFNLNSIETREIFSNFLPMLISQLPYTSAPLIGMFWSVYLSIDGQSYLSYSYSLTSFLSVIVGKGVSTVALPYMAEGLGNGAQSCIVLESMQKFKFIFLVSLWVAVVFYSLRIPLLKLIFERGSFDSQSVNGTANIIPFFLVGMISSSLMNLVRNIYYSMKTFWRTALIGVTVPMIYFCLSWLLGKLLGLTGIAFAFAISYTIFMLISLYYIPNTKTGFWSIELLYFIGHALIASFFAVWGMSCLNIALKACVWLPLRFLICAGIGSIIYWFLAICITPSKIKPYYNCLKNLRST